MYINESELVLNPDGSIYHLNLHPEELADKVILVGDPDRVPMISRYFDRVDTVKQRREFVTHTGELHGERLSVISTGIGVGSIDITINELDALANVDFKTRQVKPIHKQLTLLRMGTCGGLHESVQLDDLIYSEYAFAFDGLLDFYKYHYDKDEQALLEAVQQHFKGLPVLSSAYATKAGLPLDSKRLHHGVTLTCSGFYGPQCRSVRAPLMDYDFFKFVQSFRFNDMPVLNFEMETATILALGRMLGHKCASISTVAANRVTQKFSNNVASAVEGMIEHMIEVLVSTNVEPYS
jgi:uridine phosphorylase